MNDQKVPHLKDCKCGQAPEPLDKTHEWYVNAPDYDNCFWHYIENNERKHTLTEITKLMNSSMSVITSLEKRALNKIKKRLAGISVKNQR